MPLYDYQCEKCGAVQERLEKPERKRVKCPVCGKLSMKRIITLVSVNCSNDDSPWVRTCLNVVSKTDTDPATVEFRKNPTRTNLKKWMAAKGLRHMDRAEIEIPEDRSSFKKDREIERERTLKGMHEARLKRERAYIGGL